MRWRRRGAIRAALGRWPVIRTATSVSLTGQLAVGDLGRWCAATLTGTAALAADVARP